jgi:hypothetical protein
LGRSRDNVSLWTGKRACSQVEDICSGECYAIERATANSVIELSVPLPQDPLERSPALVVDRITPSA